MRVGLLALCIGLGVQPLVAASNIDGEVDSQLDHDQGTYLNTYSGVVSLTV